MKVGGNQNEKKKTSAGGEQWAGPNSKFATGIMYLCEYAAHVIIPFLVALT